MLGLALWPAAPLPCGAERDFAVVRSYGGNFLVTAPDITNAGVGASLAEVTREAVFDLLGHENEWRRAAGIHMRAREKRTPRGEVQLWTVTVTKDEFKVVEEDVYPNKRNDVMVLQVVSLCLDDIVRAAHLEKRGLRGRALPLWLFCGVAENLSRENVAGLRQFASDIVTYGRFLPLEQLLRVKSLPSDELQRELFFKESGSVVDFLLHQKEGPSKLKRAIEGPGAEDDFATSLLSAFAGDFGGLAQFQDRWKEFAVERAQRTIGGPKMLLSETKQALDRVLIVNIPVIDRDSLEEKVVTTDLEGLFRHRNKRTVQRIASEKASEVFELRLRARAEFAPVLKEYGLALSAIWRNDRGAFKRHFALAERRRRELEKSPYFEAEETEDVNTADQ